jgi:hypothetical protein
MKTIKTFEEFINESIKDSENILQKAMDILSDYDINDYPGGDGEIDDYGYDDDNLPYINFDSKKDALKAKNILDKHKVTCNIDSNYNYVLNLY